MATSIDIKDADQLLSTKAEAMLFKATARRIYGKDCRFRME
jgi:hypothetical protein